LDEFHGLCSCVWVKGQAAGACQGYVSATSEYSGATAWEAKRRRRSIRNDKSDQHALRWDCSYSNFKKKAINPGKVTLLRIDGLLMSNVEKEAGLSNFEPISSLLPAERYVPLVEKSHQFLLNTSRVFPGNGSSTDLETYSLMRTRCRFCTKRRLFIATVWKICMLITEVRYRSFRCLYKGIITLLGYCKSREPRQPELFYV
jgi:hypothetical protein